MTAAMFGLAHRAMLLAASRSCAKANAASVRLTPLEDRLARLLATIPIEVQREGLSIGAATVIRANSAGPSAGSAIGASVECFTMPNTRPLPIFEQYGVRGPLAGPRRPIWRESKRSFAPPWATSSASASHCEGRAPRWAFRPPVGGGADDVGGPNIAVIAKAPGAAAPPRPSPGAHRALGR